MTDEFGMEDLLAQSVEAKPGSVVEGTIVSQSGDYLLINVGLKQEAALPAKEFAPNLPQPGEKFSVLIVVVPPYRLFKLN